MSTNGQTKNLDITDLALVQMSNHDIWTAEEEQQLTQAYKKSQAIGDRNKIAEKNIRLVIKIAKRYQNRGLPLVDLIAHGCLGLMHAIEKFDPDRGFKFSTYATWWIEQRIEHGIMNENKTIRIPVHIQKRLKSVWLHTQELKKEFQREPTSSEIADRLNIKESDITTAEELVSLCDCIEETLIIDGKETSIYEISSNEEDESPETSITNELRSKLIKKFMDKLTDNERFVLSRRFGLDGLNPQTSEEVAEALQLTQGHIRKIQSRAVKNLKKSMEKAGIHADII